MPKMSKSRKSQKTTKRRRNKSTKRRMRGGCGCNNAAPVATTAIMQGGNGCGVPRMSGGNSLVNVPKDAYYPLSNDSRLQEANISSRILGGGRKTKRGHKKGKKHHKMAGGSAFAPHDAVSSFGNYQLGASNLLRNISTVDPAINAQPVVNTYSEHSHPLV